MKLKESLRPLYIFTKIFCQSPYKYNNDEKMYTTDLLAICYSVGITLGVSTYFHANPDVLGKASALLEYTALFRYFELMYMALIILCICLRTKKIAKVMSKMQVIDENLEKLIGPFDSKSVRTLTIVAIVSFLSNLLLHILGRCLVWREENVLYALMICWKEICSHTFKIQVCIILTVSLTRLQMLCKYFHNLDVKGKALLADETLLQNIVENIHSIHNELCSTCMDINNIFGVQTLMFFVKALTAGVGTMYAALLLKDELNLIAGLKLLTLFHWIVWRMFCLTMMAYLYHSILQQVSGIKKIIHKILRKARGQPLRATLRIFALHEMNRNLQFTVCGLFSIDLTMIQMAIASIATYVLLLIQLRAS